MPEASRVSVNLSDELLESLREMAGRENTTITEALKRSIDVRKFLGEQKTEGRTILVVDPKTQTQREIVLF